MKIEAGTEYDLENIGTGQKARLQVVELYARLGQYMMWARVLTHEVRVVRGVVGVRSRAGAFVVLPKARLKDVSWFTQALKGLPLVMAPLGRPKDGVPIVNCGAIPGLWSGDKDDKDQLLEGCVKVIDAYLYWEEHKRLPDWLRLAKLGMYAD